MDSVDRPRWRGLALVEQGAISAPMKLLPLFVLFPLFAGCTFSGLPADVELASLSEEQALQLCEATNKFRAENLPATDVDAFACNLRGDVAGEVSVAAGGEHAEACDEALQTCENDDDLGDWCDAAATHFEACDVSTVQRYEACVREQIESIKAANAEFTCAEPFFEPRREAQEGDDTQTACEAYAEDCQLDRVPLLASP